MIWEKLWLSLFSFLTLYDCSTEVPRDFSNICGSGQWKGIRNCTRYLYPAGFTWSLQKYSKGVKKIGVLKLWCICTAPKSGSFLKRNVSPQLSSSVEHRDFSYVPNVLIAFEDCRRLFFPVNICTSLIEPCHNTVYCRCIRKVVPAAKTVSLICVLTVYV